MPSKRNHEAEYRRRIARGLARGLTRSQARGHAKPNEPAVAIIKKAKQHDLRFQHGLRLLGEGKSLTQSARTIGMSPERLRRLLGAAKVARKRGSRWIIRKNIPRQFLVYSAGKAITMVVSDLKAAAAVGTYMNAVKLFLGSNDIRHLARHRDESITDISGKSHPFETRPNVLYRLNASETESFEQVYRIVV